MWKAYKNNAKTKRKLFSEVQKRQIAAKQQFMCYGEICDGQKMLTSTWELDHITPLFLNGDNALHNLAILCPDCHARKTQHEKVQFAFNIRKEKLNLNSTNLSIQAQIERANLKFTELTNSWNSEFQEFKQKTSNPKRSDEQNAREIKQPEKVPTVPIRRIRRNRNKNGGVYMNSGRFRIVYYINEIEHRKDIKLSHSVAYVENIAKNLGLTEIAIAKWKKRMRNNV